MTSRSLLLTLGLTLLLATPSLAEVKEGAFTFSLFGGQYGFDDEQRLKTEAAYGTRLGYNLTENWGLESQFTYVQLVPKSSAETDSKTGEQYSLSANVLYHMMPKNQLVPFLSLGGGWSKIRNDFEGGNEDGTLNFGGGLKYFVNDSTALRGDFTEIMSFHPKTYGHGSYWNNYEYTAGVTFQFGTSPAAPAPVVAETTEKPAAALQPPPAAKPVAAEVKPLPPIAPVEAAPKVAAPEAAVPVCAPSPVCVPPPAMAAPAPAVVAKAANPPNGCKEIVVRNVRELKNGVEVVTDSPIESYTTLKLTDPTRLAVDICSGTDGLNGGKSLSYKITLKQISAVRVGSHPGKVRVTFDSPQARFPDHQIEKTAHGFRLILKQIKKKRAKPCICK